MVSTNGLLCADCCLGEGVIRLTASDVLDLNREGHNDKMGIMREISWFLIFLLDEYNRKLYAARHPAPSGGGRRVGHPDGS